MARCPAHDDRTPSLSISLGEQGILIRCFARCPLDAVLQAVGIDKKLLFYHRWENGMPGTARKNRPKRTLDTRHKYTDEAGITLFECFRWKPKDFSYRHRSASGEWVWNLEGCRLVIYNLHLLAKCARKDRVVLVVEGEKKADLLTTHGLLATCNPGGCGMGWRPEYSEQLAGFHVAILPDNDREGLRHAATVAGLLLGWVASLGIVTLPTLGPKEDVHDWFTKHGGSAALLLDLVSQGPRYRRV